MKSKEFLLLCSLAALVSACENKSTTRNGTADSESAANEAENEAAAAEEAAIAAMAAEGLSGSVPSANLSSDDLAKVCRAAVAQQFLRDPSIMQVTSNRDGLVRIQYRRPDDPKLWKSDCKIEGEKVLWRTVDAFPNSGAGRWRNTPDDDVLTYQMAGNVITIHAQFSDGSSTTEKYTF